MNAGGPLHRVAARCVPLQPGEPCGDATAHLPLPGGGALLAIVDGLGHGPEAARAAQAALRLLADDPGPDLPLLMARLDAGLAATRGAAVGLVRIDGARLQHAGIGNTRTLRWRDGQLLRLPSQYGIVGGGLMHETAVAVVDVRPDDWLLLFTDGLDEMLQLSVPLPEWTRDPALLCEHLLARWRHVRDDAGVLACLVGGP